MKIALVDDDPRALAQLEQYLTEQLGRETEISHYGSGEALLADWRPGAFELVVLDIISWCSSHADKRSVHRMAC